uniref:Uncharacterized protein n=1 Tax=Arundo donax TaxID=35708 RepID=A0A0A8XMT9_ARUDO
MRSHGPPPHAPQPMLLLCLPAMCGSRALRQGAGEVAVPWDLMGVLALSSSAVSRAHAQAWRRWRLGRRCRWRCCAKARLRRGSTALHGSGQADGWPWIGPGGSEEAGRCRMAAAGEEARHGGDSGAEE